MVNQKVLLLGAAFGFVLGGWIALMITGEVLTFWTFFLGFLGAFLGFLVVYYFYRTFY